MKVRCSLAVLAWVLLLTGCRSVYYSAWEKVGVHKRDLLKERVTEARDGQQAASEQFTNALTRLKQITGFQGGDLEKVYNDLERDYRKSLDRADTVHKRVAAVESVAKDLFSEWEREIGEISTESLRMSSRARLQETRQRYNELHQALKRAENSMQPVLVRFKDHVLYLKHNLNAAAIASLKGETASIQTDISRLIEDMNNAIEQADKFIKSMP